MGFPPILYVEGADDVSVINALLFRHGLDTNRGGQHLLIKQLQTVAAVLDAMPEAIRASTDRALGFVVDVDVATSSRWNAVRDRLHAAGIVAPPACPPDGFIDKLPEYPEPFGIWLMPDCVTGNAKLEHLVESLIPPGDPLWPHARASVHRAAEIVDEANAQRGEEVYSRFRDVDAIKAEIHRWLSWQARPGAGLGAAVNANILGCDSPQAQRFLRWLKKLYGFEQLAV